MATKNKTHQKIKLVVWDADNTLWDGSVYYTDKKAVQIKPGTQAALKELDKRGIINTLCSKNEYKDVEAMLKKLNIDHYFKKPQVGWGLKSEAIKKLHKLFRTPYEQMIFIDDDPFQKAEVNSQIPDLKTISLSDPIDILNVKGIKPEKQTDEDRQRVRILKQQRDREQAEKNFGGNYKDFLRRCKIKMIIRKIKAKDWPRVIQLLNRTNELNATGNRYELTKLKKISKLNKDKILVAELTDKFGDYGLIAESIIETQKRNIWSIRELTVSCRTMGRGVGSTLVLAILRLAQKTNIKKVQGYVMPTESNWRMQPLFEKRGFKKIADNRKIKKYEFDLKNSIKPYPDWIKLTIKL